MTRKDYRLIASALREAKPPKSGPDSVFVIHDFADLKPANDYFLMLCLGEQWRRTAHFLACALSKDNDRFDSDKFLQACGIPSEDTSAN